MQHGHHFGGAAQFSVQHRLINKLDVEDAKILRRSTEAIVNQVEALKRMVNEFNQYARVPELELCHLDFNRLVREVLSLYETTSMTIDSHYVDSLPKVQGYLHHDTRCLLLDF